ncbi:MAG: MBOAT family protein [Deltaproteobacteria bacterium]|nr:MBOAT family protein [Deltaproteobacteria bacterium]
MIFNSLAFLIFLPVVLVLVATLPKRWRNAMLLVASYIFYGYWDWRFVGLLFATTVVDFWVGQHIYATNDRLRRRRILLLSLGVNLGALGFFKYFNFFIYSAAAALQSVGLHGSIPTLSIILPVGISFYVFQSMSYTIDIYRREMEPAQSFWDFALYVAYFPQLVAGPIERATHLLPQIVNPGRFSPERANIAVVLIIVGFAKKVLIADNLAPEVERIFSDPGHMSSGELLRGAYYFAFQIYGDFAGYSDIARGVSELLGIRLMFNFNQPYLSQSITEFWRRWHISLSTWLRDYLYVPLGGNRLGEWKTYRNLMLTMLIGGLWHGANWTFVAWGGINGLYLAVERRLGIGRGLSAAEANPALQWVGRVALTLLTFHLVTLTWIFFRAPNFGVAFEYLAGIAQLRDLTAIGVWPFAVAAALLAIDIPQNRSGDHAVFLRMPWWVQSPVYCGLAFAVLGRLLWGGKELPFIYFQF